MDVRAGPRTRY